MSPETKLLLVCVPAAFATAVALFYWYKTRKREFRAAGHVSGLYIYPIKSCKGIPLDSAQCLLEGLRYDRRWAVIDSKGETLTCSKVATMVLISPSFDKEMENLILDAPGMETLKIPLSRRTDKIKDIQVTRTWAKGVSVGDAASDWVSRFLDIPGCELCCVVKPRYLVEDPKWGDRAQPGDKVGFADNTPLMICSQASLKELSKHYKEPVNMGRFRPNIIVDGGTPYDEDSWRTVMIGNTVRLRWIKACSRCSAINVDPVRGVRTLEPLHTLSRVRKIPCADRRHQGKPWFGWNACPDVIGLIKVGDLVWVLSE